MEGVKRSAEVSDKLSVNDLSFLKSNGVKVVDSDLVDLNIIDVFPRTNLMSVGTLRFFLKCLFKMIVALFQAILKMVSRNALQIKFKNTLPIEANVFVQHSNVHIIKGTYMTKLLSVCKKNSFTFNSLLLSLLWLSVPENKDLITYRDEILVPLNARNFLLCRKPLQSKIDMFVSGGKIETCDIKLNSFKNDTYDSVVNLAKDMNDKV